MSNIPAAMKLARRGLVALLLAAPLAAQAIVDVNKNFVPINITPGQNSTLTVNLANSALTPATGIAFTDNLPDNNGGADEVTVVGLVSNSCGGTPVVTPGAALFSLSGGTIPAGNGTDPGTCSLVITVTSAAQGTHINTIPVGGVTSTNEGSNPQLASATLFVSSFQPVTVAKTFSNAAGNNILHAGAVGSYSIVITNPNVSALTSAAFTDTFDAFVVGAGAATTNTCGGTIQNAGAAIFGDGDTTLRLVGGTIPGGSPSGSCTITFPVRALNTTVARNNDAVNTIPAGAISNDQVVTNTLSAQVTINVEIGGVVSKSFNPTSVRSDSNQTSQLTINLQNRNATAITGAALTDTLPAGLEVAATPGITTTPSNCATVNAAAGATSVAITNANIAAAGTGNDAIGQCSVQVNVVPSAAQQGVVTTYNNTIAAGSYGAGLPSYNEATASLTTTSPISGTKTFNPVTRQRGQVTQATLTLINDSPVDATITNFLDNLNTLENGYVVANPAGASTTCGGTLGATPGSNNVTLTGGTIPGNDSCTILFNVQVPAGATIGDAFNTIIAADLATNLGSARTNFSAKLTVIDGTIGGSKAFNVTTKPVSSDVGLTVTLNNNNGVDTTAVNFTDDLTTMDPGGKVFVSPSGVTANTCGGTVTAVPYTQTFSLAGGTVPANGSCSLTVQVFGLKGVPLDSTRTNTIPPGAITSSAGSNAGTLAANIVFTSPHSVSKVFNPSTVPRGGSTTATITLNNTSDSTATITTFTDDLGATMGANTVAIAAAPTSSCTGTSITTGAGPTLTLTGGTIPANGSCTITVPLTVLNAATLAEHINTVAINGLDTDLGNNQVAASATLTVIAPVAISKSFSPSSFAVNLAAVTRLTVNISTPANSVALTNLSLSDDLSGTMGAGHVIANPPNILNTCGGTLTAPAGATGWSLSGGTLPSGANTCSIMLDVQTPAGVNNTRTNTIPAGTLGNAQNLSNVAAATATVARASAPDLTVLNKTFIPDIINGGADSQLQLLFVNNEPGAQTLTNVSITDNYPLGMVVNSNPNPTFTGAGCSNAQFIANPGAGSFTMSGATIAAGATCTLTLETTSFQDGNLTNTIPIGAMTSDQGASNPNLVSKTLTVTRNVNVQKYFTPDVVEQGGTSTLHLLIFNTNNVARTGCAPGVPACGAQGFYVQDTLPAGITVAPGATTNTCGGGAFLADQTLVNGSLGANDSIISVVGGSYPGRSFCEVTIPVTGTASGNYDNTIPANTMLAQEGSQNPDATTDRLTIIARPTIAKAFSPAAIGIGGSSTVTFTLSNPNGVALLAGGLTNARFTDTLVNMSIAAPGAAGGSCAGVGSNQFAAGATSLSFTGLSIPAASSCTVTVVVTSSTVGVQPNQTSGVISNQTQTAGDPSNIANLTVNNGPTITKAFGTPSIGAGSTTALVFTLSNPNATPITGANPAFSDVFPTTPGAMTLANTTTGGTCVGAAVTDNLGGALNAGDVGIQVSGGTIPAGGSCTVIVQITASTTGTYTNTSTVLSTVEAGASAAPATADLTVGNGQPLSGFVYYDANNNGSRDAGEDWTAGAPVFVNLVQGGVVVQTQTVPAGAGGYTFAAVPSGSYQVIVTDAAGNIVPAAPVGFLFVAPGDGQQPATVSNSPALLYNFGLLNGGRISGRVFRDTGPTANNGVQESPSAEPGIAGVTLQLTDCAATVFATTVTNGSGDYQFGVPVGVADGATLCVVETQPANFISTGASLGATPLPSGVATSVGGTSYTYNRATPERIQFTYAAATPVYAQLNFAEVPPNSFTTDNVTTTAPGTTVYHPHRFRAGSAGSVVFSTTASANPALPGWQEVLFTDTNCNGLFDSGEPQITGAITLAANQEICILNREFVPLGAPTNAQNVVQVTATFTYANANPALVDVQRRTDTTTVGDAGGAALKLIKTVDTPTASPGTQLTYTLTYRNDSAQPLNSIVVNDATPPYTSYVGGSAVCVGAPPAVITACNVTVQPGNGATGALAWTLTGALNPGAQGQVQYRVTVDAN